MWALNSSEIASASHEPVRQAVLLVGGRGTRLGSLVANLPKPMMAMDDRRCFLDILLGEFARQGFDDLILVAGYLGDQLRARFHGRRIGEARVRVVVEEEARGTGGALREAEPLLASRFIVSNGDSFLDANVRAFVARWGGLNPGEAALLLARVEDSSRYGTVELDGSRVAAFLEKEPERRGPGMINAGVYLMTREILGEINVLPCSMERDVFPALVVRGALFASPSEGYFIDIGLPDTLEEARRALPVLLRRPAVFFDRDGVLNVDHGHVGGRDRFEWMDGAIDAVRLVNDRGWRAVVVTNQAGVAKGYYSEDDVRTLHAFMSDELARAGAFIDRFYHCPFHPEGTAPGYRLDHTHRKPAPGMILHALGELDIDPSTSLLIGDKDSDLAAAAAAHIKGVPFSGGNVAAALRAHVARRSDAREGADR